MKKTLPALICAAFLGTEVFFGSFDQFIDFFTIEIFGELTAFLWDIHEMISRIAGDGLPVVVDSSGVVAKVV